MYNVIFYLVFTVRMNVEKVNFYFEHTEWRMLTLLFIWVLLLGFPSPPQVVSCCFNQLFLLTEWRIFNVTTGQTNKSRSLCFQNLKVSLCENLNSCQVKCSVFRYQHQGHTARFKPFSVPLAILPLFFSNTQSLTMNVVWFGNFTMPVSCSVFYPCD